MLHCRERVLKVSGWQSEKGLSGAVHEWHRQCIQRASHVPGAGTYFAHVCTATAHLLQVDDYMPQMFRLMLALQHACLHACRCPGGVWHTLAMTSALL